MTEKGAQRNSETRIDLYQELFARDRRLLAQRGGILVHTFRNASGVAALEVETGVARFVLLPFQGQQIWDAWAGLLLASAQTPPPN